MSNLRFQNSFSLALVALGLSYGCSSDPAESTVSSASAGAGAGMAGTLATTTAGAGAGNSAGAAGGEGGSSGSPASAGTNAGGAAGSAVDPVAAGAGAGGALTAGGAAGSAGSGAEEPVELEDFSFFVTSMDKMLELAGDENGFGGDLRFGEETGLAGADKICETIAEASMPGSAAKQWRAFLSVTDDGTGTPVNAIDRIGSGPWYDRNGRLIAENVEGLLGVRPDGDPQAAMDLPNENGEPNHIYNGQEVDNHDTLTGSNAEGELASDNPDETCADWTRNDMPLGQPMIGHSWPRNADNLDNGGNWMSDHNAQGCLAATNLEQNGGGEQGCNGVGCGGGYGGIYCFALTR